MKGGDGHTFLFGQLVEFVGGPKDGSRVRLHTLSSTLYIKVDPDLTELLEASIEVLERGMAVVPEVKLARYRRRGDSYLYDFEGEEAL